MCTQTDTAEIHCGTHCNDHSRWEPPVRGDHTTGSSREGQGRGCWCLASGSRPRSYDAHQVFDTVLDIDTELQRSTLAYEATLRASQTSVVLDGMPGALADKLQVTEVLTNVGGLSLFSELCVGVAALPVRWRQCFPRT